MQPLPCVCEVAKPSHGIKLDEGIAAAWLLWMGSPQKYGPADEALGDVPRPGVAGEADGATALDARVALLLRRRSALLHHVTDGAGSGGQQGSAPGDFK